MSRIIREIQPYWTAVEPVLSIHSAADYDQAIAHLNELLDLVGTNEEHPLYELLDTLGTLLHAYEEQHISLPQAGGADILQYLMTEHRLRQSDLPEIGSQGVVSEILNGKRSLNVRQIKALAERFNLSPAVFL